MLENPAHPKNDEEIKVDKEPHVLNKHPHEGVKPKGVSAEPHPLDRKSGTGRGLKQLEFLEKLNFISQQGSQQRRSWKTWLGDR